MTMDEMKPYTSKVAESRDPTGSTMRPILYHQVSPQRLFTRSGEMYYFGALDAKQEDRFVKNFPGCLIDDPPGRRRWYNHVVTHGVAHGMYIHDLYCFKALSIAQQKQQSQLRGFTCGSESDSDHHDLPQQFDTSLTRWSTKIYLTLSKSGTFPPNGPTTKLLQTNSSSDG